MNFLIVGYGIQGKKRNKILKKYNLNCVGIVDPIEKGAKYKTLREVPLKNYDSVIICTPEKVKYELVEYSVKNKKNILIEKPFNINEKKFKNLNKLIKKNNISFYIAFNHRFESSLIDLKKLIKNNYFGKLYHCNFYYGNGTAKEVKNSLWRDDKLGVITDLGSHLIDLSVFLFKNKEIGDFKLISKNNFENKAPDYALLTNTNKKFKINLEVSLCSWKNTFKCDLYGEKGSAHINSLTKWSKSSLTIRDRILPSGVPKEKTKYYKKGDSTWEKELKFFIELIKKRVPYNIDKDTFINSSFKNIL